MSTGLGASECLRGQDACLTIGSWKNPPRELGPAYWNHGVVLTSESMSRHLVVKCWRSDLRKRCGEDLRIAMLNGELMNITRLAGGSI